MESEAGIKRRRLDPLVALFTALGALVYVVPGFEGWLTRDSALYVYAGQMVAEGAAPYEAAMNRAGPFAHLLPGAGVWLGRLAGADDVLGARLVFFALSVVCVPLTYLVARRALDSRMAGAVAAGAFLAFTGFADFATGGPQSKTPVVTFLLCALLCTLGRRRAWAGVWTAVGTLTWQPVFAAAAAGAAVAILAEPGWRDRVRAGTRYAGGGLAVLLVMVAYFWLHDALRYFVEGFFTANAEYTKQPSALGDLPVTWELLMEGFGPGVWVLLGGTAALLAAGAATLLPRWSRRRVPLLTLAAAQLAGLAWSVSIFNGWADAFMLLPLSAVGVGLIGLAIDRLAGRRPDRGPATRLATRLATGLVAVAVLAVAASSAVVLHRSAERTLLVQRAATEAVVGRLPAEAPVLSVEAPHPLVLSARHNPTRYLLFTNGLDLYFDDHLIGGLDGYADWIADERIAAIALTDARSHEWIEPLLEEQYVEVGTAPDWVWYVRKDVDSDVRRAMRADLAALSWAD